MTKEEKEKLIELSDLNREDNIRYISSEAQGIAIALDSDRAAPSICKLERAYICGRRKSEKRIEELKKESADLKEKYVQNICDCDICDTYCNSQLTKAKEIIKNLMMFAEIDSREYEKEYKEAEQFLREVENV